MSLLRHRENDTALSEFHHTGGTSHGDSEDAEPKTVSDLFCFSLSSFCLPYSSITMAITSTNWRNPIYILSDLYDYSSFFPLVISFQSQKIFNGIKIALLVGVWILFTGILMSKDEKVLAHHNLAVPIQKNKSRSLLISFSICECHCLTCENNFDRLCA